MQVKCSTCNQPVDSGTLAKHLFGTALGAWAGAVIVAKLRAKLKPPAKPITVRINVKDALQRDIEEAARRRQARAAKFSPN